MFSIDCEQSAELEAARLGNIVFWRAAFYPDSEASGFDLLTSPSWLFLEVWEICQSSRTKELEMGEKLQMEMG